MRLGSGFAIGGLQEFYKGSLFGRSVSGSGFGVLARTVLGFRVLGVEA